MQRAPLVIADLTTINFLGQTVEGFSGILAEVPLPWSGLSFSMLFCFDFPCWLKVVKAEFLIKVKSSFLGLDFLHKLQTVLSARSGQVFQKAQFKQEADGQIPSRLWKLNKLALESVTIFRYSLPSTDAHWLNKSRTQRKWISANTLCDSLSNKFVI